MKKWITPIIYSIMLALAFIYRNDIFTWLKTNDSYPLLLLLAALLALFPIFPYKAIIAVLGYTYGAFWGSVTAWLATNAAAVIVYLAASLYRDSGRAFLAKFRQLDSFTAVVESHPFKAIVIARLLPIVPQMAVNVYAGITRVPFWTYFLATGLGKMPAILFYAALGQGFTNHPVQMGILIILILSASMVGLAVHHKIKRNSRT
ncbi:TVP38/TMEM64 family protein [Paenibacillus dakarensis]|uniref:TVP38/TMEM64 family protein n=1 Tax=Paenibacillus dakarensis TaxID=1527293 RepID=UPI0006D5835B|nr:VTT domain-containing protein [Paenibacillus dakarensis]